MQKYRILITSYHYHPEINPRAFRTYELVKEFLRMGHSVDLFIPDSGHCYEDNKNLRVFFVAPRFINKRKRILKEFLKQSSFLDIYSKIRRIYNYFWTPVNNDYAVKLEDALKQVQKEDYNLLISIGLPIFNHYGTAQFVKKYKLNIAVKVADYGDPFFFNQEQNLADKYKKIEQEILDCFDYASIPTKNAVGAFEYFKTSDKIHIIPQGIDTQSIKIATYRKNDIPTFAYAGMFYSGIRNPKLLFDFLLTLPFDFRFIIYTNTESKQLIEKYTKVLGEKVIVNDFIPRFEVIYKISQMDFLINIENNSNIQIPSKLIDYTLSGRPIFNMKPNDLDKEKFLRFISGYYSGRLEIDIEQFKINNVCQKFLNLIE